jgi:carboxylate-amine ligase
VFPELNGAQRQRRMIESGAPMEEVFATSVRETHATYSQEVPA